MSGLAGVAKRLRSSDVDSKIVIEEYETQYELTQKALDDEKVKNNALEGEIRTLRDESEIKQKALRWAYNCIWLVPVLCLSILVFPHVCQGLSPNGFCANFRLPDLAQVALITGPMVLLGTLLGFVLKGVLGPKSDKSESDVSLVKIFELLRKSGH